MLSDLMSLKNVQKVEQSFDVGLCQLLTRQCSRHELTVSYVLVLRKAELLEELLDVSD